MASSQARVEAAAREIMDFLPLVSAADGRTARACAERALAAADEAEPTQPPCPNPHGMTQEFPEDIIESRAWRIKGVGIYGTDIDVIAIDEYRELAHQQKTTMETLTRWAESAKENEERADRAERAARELAEAVRRWLSETGPGQHTNTAKGRGMAQRALAAHPEYDPARKDAEATPQGQAQRSPHPPDPTAEQQT